MSNETAIQQVKRAIREPYAWPGGYPVYTVLTDGALLCPECARNEFKRIAFYARHPQNSGWEPAGAAVLWEGSDECAQCGKNLPSAYGD